jgi:rare lipoprotein A
MPFQYFIPTFLFSIACWHIPSAKAQGCANWGGQTGVASWYGARFNGGRTAGGGRFDMDAMTAAHPCLPLGTKILVTVIDTGQTLEVTVNDRMPKHRRILDLAAGAARALGIASRGVAQVRLSRTPGGEPVAQTSLSK